MPSIFALPSFASITRRICASSARAKAGKSRKAVITARSTRTSIHRMAHENVLQDREAVRQVQSGIAQPRHGAAPRTEQPEQAVDHGIHRQYRLGAAALIAAQQAQISWIAH